MLRKLKRERLFVGVHTSLRLVCNAEDFRNTQPTYDRLQHQRTFSNGKLARVRTHLWNDNINDKHILPRTQEKQFGTVQFSFNTSADAIRRPFIAGYILKAKQSGFVRLTSGLGAGRGHLPLLGQHILEQDHTQPCFRNRHPFRHPHLSGNAHLRGRCLSGQSREKQQPQPQHQPLQEPTPPQPGATACCLLSFVFCLFHLSLTSRGFHGLQIRFNLLRPFPGNGAHPLSFLELLALQHQRVTLQRVFPELHLVGVARADL